MASEIFVPDSANSKQRVSLLGEIYFIKLSFNTRQNSWHFSLSDSLDIPLLNEIQLVANQNITYRFRSEGFPQGDFYCIRAKNTAEELGRDNFGYDKDYALMFVSDIEVGRG